MDEREHWTRRYRSAPPSDRGECNPFVLEALSRIPARGRALEVAMGAGHTAVHLAAAGFDVIGIDIAGEAVTAAVALARSRGLWIGGVLADLVHPPLARGSVDLIVGLKYLERGLFPALVDALRPGGHLIWQTFTTAQCTKGWGPRNPDHLLLPGEILTLTRGLVPVLHREVDEGERGWLASLLACK